MKKINLGALLPLSLLIVLIYACSIQINVLLPPLGKVLNPFSGLVQNGNDSELNDMNLDLNVPGVKSNVQIFFDERKVPHIYAHNDHDLYYAQGYVTASLRLWQMDFICYHASGRISEIIDSQGHNDYDRNQRRIGIMEAAKSSLKVIRRDSASYDALSAYTDGVNAYIKQLSPEKIPPEYKMFDYMPEPWTNLKSILILKSLGDMLSGYEEDLDMTKALLVLGERDYNKLFPDDNGHNTPLNLTDTVSAPKNFIHKPNYLDYSYMTSSGDYSKTSYNQKLGSNSWVLAGKITKTGYPILANDPHLNLSLPCSWLEMQLSAPGLNVYGVTIPGVPAVVIGFNQNIAWGITNSADDVKDWYKVDVKDHYRFYKIDDQWKKMEYRIEEVKRRSKSAIMDTVYLTKQGPIVNTENFVFNKQTALVNFALRWTLHHPSNDLVTFFKLNKAKDYQDFKQAISSFNCPVLNFSFASSDNVIAINHQGLLPVKKNGQGKFLMDGRYSRDILDRYIPADSMPHVLNPSSGYALSANQRPTNQDFPYYYNGYFSESRAYRINQLLQGRRQLDVASTQKMQLDNVNAFTVQALSALVKNVDATHFDRYQMKLLADLKRWDCNYLRDEERAVFYELWWKSVKTNTWDELQMIPGFQKSPSDYVLLDLVKDHPNDGFFDQKSTNRIETAKDIITQSFLQAFRGFQSLKKENKSRWGLYNIVTLRHLSDLDALSVVNLKMDGSAGAINAMSSNWGPSWRMVVQLGKTPQGFGIYPGGQSGNPGSKFYDNYVADWERGKYYKLNYFVNERDARSASTGYWKLNKKQR